MLPFESNKKKLIIFVQTYKLIYIALNPFAIEIFHFESFQLEI